MNLKEQLYFVFVRPQFASNLGSSVRVMKNMGFEKLILVRPECEVGMEARSFAMKGAPILDQARFVPSLEQVAAELGLLIATTGRFRGARSRLITLPQLEREVFSNFQAPRAAIVFGSEDNGLRREELSLCQWLVEIPTGSAYPVINLAQSVAIVAYQLHLISSRTSQRQKKAPASPERVEALLQNFQQFIERLSPSTRLSPERLMLRLRKITAGSALEREDVNMLQGLLKEIDRCIR